LSDDTRDTDADLALEERLRRDLGRLAERAQPSPDALDRILHRPRRHRAHTGFIVTGLAAVAAAVLVTALPHTFSRDRQTVHVDGTAAAAIERPAGRAVFVSDSRLFVLGPSSSDPVPLDVTGPAGNPTWSRDTNWIAYRQIARPDHPESIHIVRPDGTGDRTVFTGAAHAFSWSPVDDLLAIAPDWKSGAGLLIAFPNGVSRNLLPRARVVSYTWARSGGALAASLDGQVLRVDLAGTRSLLWRSPEGQQVMLGGWWPRDRGVLFWMLPPGDDISRVDGVPLLALSLGGPAPAQPKPLVTTLRYHRWLAWSPNGEQLLTVAGDGHEPWSNKQLALCQPAAGTCVELPQPANTVSLDPAWSPDGSRIAFVRAAAKGTDDAGRTFAHWFDTRQLWVANADGTDARQVAVAAPGVVQPSWSADGDTIRYSTSTDVRQVSLFGGDQRLTGALVGGQGDAGPDAYGKGRWLGIAIWAP
jgi:TolB protein